MVQLLESAGAKSQGQYRVVNTGDQPLAVEVVISKRLVDGQYQEQLVASDDFMVLPPQAMVPPGQFQSFRVRYIGEPGLSASESYRISFEQVSLDNKPTESGVEMLFNFATLVFVDPPKPALNLSASIVDGKLRIDNLGNGVAPLDGYQFEFGHQGHTVQLPWSEISPVSPANYVLPNLPLLLPLTAVVPAKLTAVDSVAIQPL
ncbi:fimbria/pilus periplasmic chaperone [Ferrimonas senticii]|uniref:fimbria/pilus periplasmic chaperone n=1 Tax=Ferrimonas senticii TaxID=394566 RepID=UPI00040F091E|nr:fimbria/pilus periplasmic chaperone [Ferrimonas senticii]